MYQKIAVTLAVCALSVAGAWMPAGALDCSQQATLIRPIPLGVSGGNINDIKKLKHHEEECFGGTLGSLVQDSSSNQYILSNNHVLAEINKAKPGQLIVQPGLVDVDCQQSASDEVATFTKAVKVKFGAGKNMVDAAIAAVQPGQVSADILNIGPIAGTFVTATPGMAVQKMGRSTCLTTGTIATVNTNANINYSETAHPRIAKFVNQIVINGDFSSAGDSGSLIVTQDACPQAVALLFAGGTSGSTQVTIANPISTVLSDFSVTMVGGCTATVSGAAPDVAQATAGGMTPGAVASATAVRDRHEDDLMKIPGAVGTGVGVGDTDQPAIVVYVNKMTPQAEAAAPKEVEGVPVKVVESGDFKAF